MPRKKNYEELDISDDFMFGKVMEDKKLCHDTLECLLGHEIGELQEVQTQKQVLITSDGKPIRLDLYTKDKAAVYDAEMQNLNGRKVENLDLSKRARFYQASLDMDYLNKGESYKKLPEGNVMFICTFDPFGKGLAKYTFENRCIEDADIRLADQTYKWFYNCACDINKVPEDLKSLYEYIQSGRTDSSLTRRIHSAVINARRNEIWRSEYMKELLIYQDIKDEGIEEGIEQGIEQGKTMFLAKIICRKYVKGISVDKIIDDIAEDTGEDTDIVMPLYEKINKLASEKREIASDADALYHGISTLLGF